MLSRESLDRIEALRQEYAEALRNAAARDGIRAELAREILAGRLTPREALARPAYGEVVFARLMGTAEPVDKPAPKVKDEESFEDVTYMRRQ